MSCRLVVRRVKRLQPQGSDGTRAYKIPAVVDADRTRLLHDAVQALRDAWQADGAQHQAPPG